MPITLVAAAGTRVPLTATANISGARITLQRLAANVGTIYVGIPSIGNTGALVSSILYDAYLDASNPSITIGMGETMADSARADLINIDAGTNGDGVAWFVENI